MTASLKQIARKKERIELAKKLWLEGLSTRVISQRLRVSPPSVRQYLRELGIVTPDECRRDELTGIHKWYEEHSGSRKK